MTSVRAAMGLWVINPSAGDKSHESNAIIPMDVAGPFMRRHISLRGISHGYKSPAERLTLVDRTSTHRPKLEEPRIRYSGATSRDVKRLARWER